MYFAVHQRPEEKIFQDDHARPHCGRTDNDLSHATSR